MLGAGGSFIPLKHLFDPGFYDSLFLNHFIALFITF
jgi:hypothetical protein